MSSADVEGLLTHQSARLAARSLERELTATVLATRDLLRLIDEAADRVEPFDRPYAEHLRRTARALTASLRSDGHALSEAAQASSADGASVREDGGVHR